MGERVTLIVTRNVVLAVSWMIVLNHAYSFTTT